MVSFKPIRDDEPSLAPVTDIHSRRSERSAEAPAAHEDDDRVDTQKLEDVVVRALGRRNLTEREVVSLVEEKGGDSTQASEVLERMRELRYVDDARVAEELVHRLSEAKGKSRAVVAREMASRGIPREVIDGALSEVSDEHERSVAIDLALKRGAQLSHVDDAAFDRRLTGYLARRGYSSGIVREAIAAARAERSQRVRFQ